MKIVSLVPSQCESISRELDRGPHRLCHHLFAKFFLRGDHPGPRSGHADRLIAISAGSFDHVALSIEVHVTGRGGGSLFTIIEKVRLSGAHTDHSEPAAPDIPPRRMYDGEAKPGSYGSVDCIPARL